MDEFRIRCGLVGLVLLSATAFAGCGGEVPKVAEKIAPAKAAGNKAVPVPAAPSPAAAKSADKPAETKAAPADDVTPAKKIAINPFQMPDMSEEFLPPKEVPKPVEQAQAIRQAERPHLRLLGFANVDGFKALVESKGDVQAIAVGDTLEGVQVVSIEPPNVTFQFASARWSTKLFDQPWQNEQTGLASSPGASRTHTTQTRSAPRTNTLAATTRTPAAAAMRGPVGPSLLGSAMGAGLPGIGSGNGVPLPPGMPSSNGSSGIPGLGSIPGMPSLGMPGGPAAMPAGGPGAMPGGVSTMPGTPSALPGGAGAPPGAGLLPGGLPN